MTVLNFPLLSRIMQAVWFSHCCVASVPVSGDVHVDANGGCGLVRETSQSVHSRSQTLHCFLHYGKLW